MRLIKSNDPSREETSLTPESVFESKYDWLLRWALHFTKKDRTAAEDLVQDTFVRLMVSWPRIKHTIDEAEPVLYSYLKYAHLTELRRGNRFNFQELALIEFDDLRLSLQEEKTADPIEVQDGLRRIVAYLCWRKRSAKSASVLLLRFFHGYFPQEIVRITLMKRGSVDELLRIAREEVKGYLADSGRMQIMHQDSPPELMPRQVAVLPELFAEELRTTIFQARTSPCLDIQQLLRRYRAIESKAIPCGLLAHIVSCERCLDAVNSIFDLPSSSERSQDGPHDYTRRSKGASGETPPASKQEIRRSIAGAKNRLRRIYEHHPRGLMILVNGDVLAMRDVNSATSELKVQATPDGPLGIIDVVSEQGLSLLTLYAPTVPPAAPPEIRQEIELSDNRKLELLLRFTSDGAVIELHYNDPLFLAAAREESEVQSWLEMEKPSEEFAARFPENEIVIVDAPPRRRSWLKRLRDRLAGIAMPEMSPMLATAMICGMVTFVLFFLSFRASSVMKPDDLLRQAASSETSPTRAGVNGVIVQTVSIKTRERKTERTFYRDVQGRRRAKEQTLEKNDAVLRSKLETAGISWNDPLSAGGFRDWHDHATVRRDVVKENEKGLLTLTTTLSDGDVASESLTVRETDFHPVGRTVELRDSGTVEIAEVNYSVLPWSSVNPDLFEPLAEMQSLGRNTHASLAPHFPMVLSLTQIDEAELGARLVLNRLHLDTSGRIELTRQADGVHVQGIVDNDDEKHQLQSQLHLVPHVLPFILTIQEMETRQGPASDVTSIQQSSVAEAEPSAIEKYFTERGMDQATVGTSAQEFVDSSFTVKHESKAIADLLNQFSSNVELSNASRIALSELLIQHKAALLAALNKEESQLLALQLIPHPAHAPDDTEGSANALRETSEHNASLCVELISSNGASPRSAQLIAPQLANSIAQLRAVALHISAAAQLSPPSPANTATANQNK